MEIKEWQVGSVIKKLILLLIAIVLILVLWVLFVVFSIPDSIIWSVSGKEPLTSFIKHKIHSVSWIIYDLTV